VRVSIDGVPALEAAEPADWHATGWGETGGYSRSEQIPLNQPLVLMRRRFMVDRGGGSSSSSPEPDNGILLWIEAETRDPSGAP
jgi:hypothetical protein